jgi:hypothetical protein
MLKIFLQGNILSNAGDALIEGTSFLTMLFEYLNFEPAKDYHIQQ